MNRTKRIATLAVAVVCALTGAAFGIAQGSAAGKTTTTTKHHPTHAGFAGMPGGPGGPGGGPGGMAVHSVDVVLNKAGTAYITETRDSGTVTAVDASAGTITIKEGTSKVTYGTPTITIPSDATVTLDGKTSSLEKLATGDQVSISSSSEGTDVFATDSSFTPAGHGPGGAGGWGGPPSGATPPSAG
jgi:hypothetical protein